MSQYVGIVDAHDDFAVQQPADFSLPESGSLRKFGLADPPFGGSRTQDVTHCCRKGPHACQSYAICNQLSIYAKVR
jgi:hypothetical protein